MEIKDIRENIRNSIDSYLASASEPCYCGAIDLVRQNLGISSLTEVYLSKYPHKDLGVMIGTINPEHMARFLVRDFLSEEYLKNNPNKISGVRIGAITPQEMFDSLLKN
jgi:hypothetical protein